MSRSGARPLQAERRARVGDDSVVLGQGVAVAAAIVRGRCFDPQADRQPRRAPQPAPPHPFAVRTGGLREQVGMGLVQLPRGRAGSLVVTAKGFAGVVPFQGEVAMATLARPCGTMALPSPAKDTGIETSSNMGFHRPGPHEN